MNKQLSLLIKILMGSFLLSISSISLVANVEVNGQTPLAQLLENKSSEDQLTPFGAQVTLPAPIDEAFPTPVIASAIAQAVYFDGTAVKKIVTQADLNRIATLTIRRMQTDVDLEELTFYNGFSNLVSLTIESSNLSAVLSVPATFDSIQFPKLREIRMSNLGNTTVPEFHLNSLEVLTIAGLNNVTALPDFSGVPELKGIHMSNSRNVESVPDFTQITKLESLTLSNMVALTSIPDFSHLPNLKYLSTLYTPLEEAINFSHLPNLISLIHSSNGAIPDYNQLPNLTSLSLSGGDFSTLPDFQFLPNLKVLHIWTTAGLLEVPDFSLIPEIVTLSIRGAGRQLTVATTDTIPDFSHMPQLANLTITGYGITTLPNFSNIHLLTSLIVNNTELMHLPNFDQIPLLKTLSLSQNALTSIPNFEEMPALERLTITNTFITELPDFQQFQLLEALYIQNNKLVTLPNLDFPRLQLLNASSNQLTEVPTLEKMVLLQTLTLTDNKLSTIPNYSLPQLRTLSLDKNNIKTLPTLDKLPQLNSFTVANNQLIELPTRVLIFPTSSLVPQNIVLNETAELGEDYLTNLPIVDQMIAKVPGFRVRTATHATRPISVGPAAREMVIPLSGISSNSPAIYLAMGPPTGLPTINVNYRFTLVDTTPPVITTDSEITYEASLTAPTESDFLLAINATAEDNVDGSVPVVADLRALQMNVVGDYIVMLSAKDLSGNTATSEVIVHIEDTTPPEITSNDLAIYEAGSQLPSEAEFLNDINASAEDIVDGSVSVTANLSNVNMNVVGDYTAILSATDTSNNTATKNVTIQIRDSIAPIIYSDNEMTYERGTVLPSETEFLSDIGARAVDHSDGVVPVTADLSTVQMETVGDYIVILSASDQSGNIATKEVIVHIANTVPPKISADLEITYEVGSSLPTDVDFLSDVNATAVDYEGVSVGVSVDLSDVEMDVLGDYIAILSASDATNNLATKEVIVHIQNTTPPVISSSDEVIYALGSPLPSEVDFINETGASAVDFKGENVPIKVDLSAVDMNNTGNYSALLIAQDESGNVTSKAVNVVIVDRTPPTLTANEELIYFIGTTRPTDAEFLAAINAEAFDNKGNPIIPTVDLSPLDMNNATTYFVTITAEDDDGNISELEVKVHVKKYVTPSEKPIKPISSNTQDKLPTTGEQVQELIFLGVVILVINSVLIYFVIHKKIRK